jgi:hypothetical protein
MSTHALIGVPTATGYKARFVHWDGYTENMIPAINRIIQQNRIAGQTFQDVRNYLLSNHWSGIYKTEQNPAEAHSHDQVWYTEDCDIDAQYLYLLDDNEVTPYIRTGEGWIALDPSKTIKIKANA